MKELNIAIPSSVLSIEHGLLLKTIKVFQIVRYTSIFGVSNLLIYRDPYTGIHKHREYLRVFTKIWKYLTTPPYLRKKLVSLDPMLKHAGILPPLRLLVFDVSKSGSIGEKRLGIVVGRGRDKADIGLKKAFSIDNPEDCLTIRGFIYVEILSMNPPIVKCISEKPYIGPELRSAISLKEIIRTYSERCVIVATSRRGTTPSTRELIEVSRASCVTVLFGAPRYGLYEIAEKEGFRLEHSTKYIWNTIPDQKVKTVRTEEALIATLAILNFHKIYS